MSKKPQIPHIAYKDFLCNQKKPNKGDSNYKDFWLKHINYCRSGVYVGGVFISGWLYWHLNFFKIPRDKKNEWGETERVIDVPQFRDNEFLIDYGIQKGWRISKPIMIFGSRRIAKSTIITSRIAYTNYIKRNSGSVVIGASSTDIANITEYFDKFYENRHECYDDLKKFGTWTREGGNIEIAFSKKETTKKDAATGEKGEINPITSELINIGKDNKYIYSYIAIRNLEHGQKVSKEELLAGITPSEVIIDEALEENTNIPTYDGFKPIKDINEGDNVIGKDGKQTKVLEKVDVGVRSLLNIKLEDGRNIDACPNHLWEVYINNEKKVVTTAYIYINQKHIDFYIPTTTKEDYKKSTTTNLYVDRIKYNGKNQAYCLKVDNKDHTFLAGDYIVTHNCGKFLYRDSFSALEPALVTSDGDYRTIPVMVGTGGSIANSKDAEQDFLYSEKRGFTPIDPQEIREIVKPKYYQYEQKSGLKVGLFPCAQMSNAGGKKIEIPLSEYLNKDFTDKQLKDLEGFNIHVTDWENAKQRVEEKIKAEYEKSDREGKKAQMYYPFQPEDCFLHIGKNPFPAEDAKKAKSLIREKGLDGEKVELEQNEKGDVIAKQSDKKVIEEFPFPGGTHDSPAVIYERPIEEHTSSIHYGTYVAGFDGYHIRTSETTDSVGVLYIYKRATPGSLNALKGFQNQVVASIATRPPQHKKFYRQAMLLMRMYNAELLPERDTSFYEYMKGMNMLHLWANCKDLAKGISPQTTADTAYGLPATNNNKEHIYKLVQNYCNEDILIGYEDDNETPIYQKGVYRIPDPMLLEEIENYGKYNNYDRLDAFGHALAWDAQLRTIGVIGGEKPTYNDVNPDSLLKKVRSRKRYPTRR